MAKKKIYAVRKGREPGIYKTWDECKKQTDGFPNAEFKGFKTAKEAEEYMNIPSIETTTNQTPTGIAPTSEVNEFTSHSPNTVVAYVDGSYDNKTRQYSYGCIILYNGKEYTYSKAYEPDENTSMRNVAGEITGSLVAMKWCIKNNINHLHLYYDYEGIEKWCTGVWKTKNPHTQKYKKIYDNYTAENNLTVTFHKVKGHSGNKYNEKADKLARQALGI